VRVIAVVEDFCDLAKLIRSLQRLEGKLECFFGTGQPTCEGFCCAWREYCLKFEGCTVSYNEKDFDKIYE
jgi:hypothetical protein